MSGNIREFCFEKDKTLNYYVTKGGSYVSDANYCTIDKQDHASDNRGIQTTGIRLVRSLKPNN